MEMRELEEPISLKLSITTDQQQGVQRRWTITRHRTPSMKEIVSGRISFPILSGPRRRFLPLQVVESSYISAQDGP